MAQNFLCLRGRVFKVNNGGGKGLFDIPGLTGIASDGASAILIMDVPSAAHDSFGLNECLGDKKILFQFGTAFGYCNIQGVVLLGDLKTQTSGKDMMGKVRSWFDDNRLANSTKPVNISLGYPGGTLKAYPMKFGHMVQDKERNIMGFSIDCIVVEPSKGK